MAIPMAQTFLGIIKILSWCIYAILAFCAVIVLTLAGSRQDILELQPFGNISVKRIKDEWTNLLTICLSAAGATWVFQQFMSHSSEKFVRVIGGTLVALIFGGLLFLLKSNVSLIYGCLELVFAVVSCVVSLSRIDANFTLSATVVFLTSIYLMIRAFDNIKKGWDQRKTLAEAPKV